MYFLHLQDIFMRAQPVSQSPALQTILICSRNSIMFPASINMFFYPIRKVNCPLSERKKKSPRKTNHLQIGDSQVLGLPSSPFVKNPPASTGDSGDAGSIPGSGRSPEGRTCSSGNPLQYSCLENSMDRGAYWATVCGVVKRQTRLRD